MKIQFKELTMKNFKSHQDLTVSFGEVTKISGDNTRGKTSILEAVSWILYGVNTLGSKLDPNPVTYEADETFVSLLLNIDDKQVLLGRELKKNKTKYYINEVPSKAGDFNELLDGLFDKELFLSLFNPLYFYTLHWEKQREMVLQYVSAPSNKEVLKDLPDVQSDKLGELFKKHSLNDLEKIHRSSKTKLEKEHIAAQSRTKTLKEQLELLPQSDQDIKLLSEKHAQLQEQMEEVDKKPAEAWKKNNAYFKKQSELKLLQKQVDESKAQWPAIRDEEIAETCQTCGQPIKEESLKVVQEAKEKRKEEYKAKHNELVAQRDKAKKELLSMEYVDVEEEQKKVRELEQQLDDIFDQIKTLKRREDMEKQVEEAKTHEVSKLKSLKESTFIIDAIKDFRAKEAELQVKKVQDLFTTLSIQLFKEQKNGDIKPTFEIEMDGKGYSKLSLSESIRAGLELREVLSEQSEVIAPCFVDNAESITKFKEPSGQLIMSQVVAGQELKVEVEN